MDSWISQRIRAVSFRRVVVWTLALVGGVLLATSDRRYILNFLAGPYKLERADLDSIHDVTATPRYYARIAGDRVLDTGLRQYTVHTQSGVETRREESAAYHALVIGNHYLVVRTAGPESRQAEGKLVPWPEDLENELFDSKDMRSLRSSFYPFYLDTDSFRRPGFVVIGVAIVFLLLFVWQALPAWRAWREPDRHPLAQRIAKWGDPIGVAVEAEHDFNNSLLRGKAGWRFGNRFLVRSSFFSFNILRLQDVLWAYKKITKHSVNFIPTGKTYEAIVNCYGGTATIRGSEKKVGEMLNFVQQRAPWAIYGFSDQLAATFNKHRQDFARGVEQRKQEWAQKSAQKP
ncbi:MAG TPA: DUF6709 family protein [Gemmatimonadales bacterium]